MLNSKLNQIREKVEDWCRKNNIATSTVCDTTGLQGVKVYEKDKRALLKLFEELNPLLSADDLHLDVQRVRGGMILAFSIRAMSESEIRQLLLQIGEEIMPTSFGDKLSDVFIYASNDSPKLVENHQVVDFNTQAIEIAEDQYKTANYGITRSNQSGRQRNLRTITATYAGRLNGKKKVSKPNSFKSNLQEALEGMATSDDVQPGDLFKKFAQALSVLGQQMGIGPLQGQLKKQGINWKKSDDGQAIILYVMNALTNAPQPIARISAETLTKPNEFEEQLLHMIDFSKGEAPGAFKQKQAEIRAQEKAVREIAHAVDPSNQSVIGQMANNNNANAQAAQQAATPKMPSMKKAATVATSAAPKAPTASVPTGNTRSNTLKNKMAAV